MASTDRLISSIMSALRSRAVSKSATVPIAGAKTKTFLTFGKAEAKNISTSGIRQYRIKPDITFPVNTETLHLSNPVLEISGKTLDNLQAAELGNVSLRLARRYQKSLPEAEKHIKAVFEGFDVSVRAKGANSVYSKLERNIIKKGKKVTTDKDASEIIQDAIGGRIQLANLTKQDVLETINTIKIDGKALTAQEKSLVQRLFNNEALTKKELEIANKLAHPVKCALAERQSEPVVRKFLLAGMKDALDRNVTTLEKLEQSGISKDLIHELRTNPNIKPMKIGDVENYKGADGIAYFSDRQIRQFERLQLATGEKHDIISCSENIDLSKYGLEGLSPSAKDAIKQSGYTTGQINVTLPDRTYAEIQIRGSGMFGEYEHLKYDAGLSKNTLGSVFNEYVDKVQALTKLEKPLYDKYAGDVYNYYRNTELGIVSKKPQLPQGFSEKLSEDNMRRLYELNKVQEAEKMKTFVPHIENANGSEFIV